MPKFEITLHIEGDVTRTIDADGEQEAREAGWLIANKEYRERDLQVTNVNVKPVSVMTPQKRLDLLTTLHDPVWVEAGKKVLPYDSRYPFFGVLIHPRAYRLVDCWNDAESANKVCHTVYDLRTGKIVYLADT